MVRDCIFRVSGDTNCENLSAWCYSWWCFCGFDFDACIGLPKEALDTSREYKKKKLGIISKFEVILNKRCKIKDEAYLHCFLPYFFVLHLILPHCFLL